MTAPTHPGSYTHSHWHRDLQKGACSPHLDLGQQVFEGCVELVRVLQLLPGATDVKSEAPGPSGSPNTLPLHTTLTPSPSLEVSSPSLLQSGEWENVPKNAWPHAKQRAPPAPRAQLTNARDTLHGNLPHTFLEAAEPGVHLSDLGLFALDQLLDDLRKEGSEGPTPEPATTLPVQSEAPP